MIEFQLHEDYFTPDNRYFVRVVGANSAMLALNTYKKIDGEYRLTFSSLMDRELLSEAFESYEEELDNYEEEFENEHL